MIGFRRHVGRFELRRIISRGHTGTVFAAHDPQLGRDVAIKLLNDGGGTYSKNANELLARAKQLAKLCHRNVVQIYDAGVDNQSLYVVMELVEGKSVASWLHEAHRDWKSIVAKFIAAGHGLAAAHSQGIAHGNFTINSLVLRGDGRVLVRDFALGTAQQSERTADLAVDQFSFCAALREALSADRQASTEMQHTRTVAATVPGRLRPHRLRRCIERGLQPDPSQRYPNMTALLADLRRTLTTTRRKSVALVGIAAAAAMATIVLRPAEKPAICHNTKTPEQVLAAIWSHARQQRVAARFQASRAPGSADAYSAVDHAFRKFSTALARTQHRSCTATHHDNSQPVHLHTRITACLARKYSAANALASLLEGPLDTRAVSASPTATRKLNDLSACSNANALPAQAPPAEDASLRAERALRDRELDEVYAYDALGKFEEALKAATTLANRAKTGAHPRILAQALFLRADLLHQLGRTEQAVGAFDEASSAAADAKYDRFLVQSWTSKALALSALGRLQEALVATDNAHLAALRGSVGPVTASRIQDAKASIMVKLGDYASAVAHYREVVSLLATHGSQRAQYHSLINLAYGLGFHKKHAEEEAVLLRALALGEKIHPPNSAHLGPVMHNLGGAQFRLAKYPEALANMTRSLELLKSSLGPEHPHVAVNHIMLGRIKSALGQHALAREHVMAGLRILEAKSEANGAGGSNLAGAVEALAGIYAASNDHENARTQFARAAAIVKTGLGHNHPQLAGVWKAHAKMELALGETTVAIGLLRRALQLLSARHTDDQAREADPSVIEVKQALRAAQRKNAKARPDKTRTLRQAHAGQAPKRSSI